MCLASAHASISVLLKFNSNGKRGPKRLLSKVKDRTLMVNVKPYFKVSIVMIVNNKTIFRSEYTYFKVTLHL